MVDRVRGPALNAISRIGAVRPELSTRELRKTIRDARSAVCRIELPDHDQILAVTSPWRESSVLAARKDATYKVQVFGRVLRNKNHGSKERRQLKDLVTKFNDRARKDEREEARKEQRNLNRGRTATDPERNERWARTQRKVRCAEVEHFENTKRRFAEATEELLGDIGNASSRARWLRAASELKQQIEGIFFGSTAGKRGRPPEDVAARAVLAGRAEGLSYRDMEAELGFHWTAAALKKLAKRYGPERKTTP